jgi:hypothetical protein
MSLCEHNIDPRMKYNFCTECGENFNLYKVSCNQCNSKQYYKDKYCRNCGNDMKQIQKICVNCQEIQPPAHDNNIDKCCNCGLLYRYEKKQWKSGNYIYNCSVIAFLIITIMLLYIFSNDNPRIINEKQTWILGFHMVVGTYILYRMEQWIDSKAKYMSNN